MSYQLLADINGNSRQDGIQYRDDSGTLSWIPADPANIDWQTYQSWLSAGNTSEPAAAVAAPVKTVALSLLLDALSPAQRNSITADHLMRLQAEVADHAGGLPITNNKVIRAAADLGITPQDWFNLAES